MEVYEIREDRSNISIDAGYMSSMIWWVLYLVFSIIHYTGEKYTL